MNREIENMLKKQAAWQRSRKDAAWLEKLRISRRLQNSLAGFASDRAKPKKGAGSEELNHNSPSRRQ